MANIWKENGNVNEHPNRNVFDLSFQNHLTMKFGTLYPVFCKEVVPGDSFNIKTAFGLKFMPLVFPVQSRMRAHMHFFYVRNKNLWKNWENFISGLEEHEHPFIGENREVSREDFYQTSNLADYLDIPTTFVHGTNRINTYQSRTTGFVDRDLTGMGRVSTDNNGRIHVTSQEISVDNFGIFSQHLWVDTDEDIYSINQMPVINHLNHWGSFSESDILANLFAMQQRAIYFYDFDLPRLSANSLFSFEFTVPTSASITNPFSNGDKFYIVPLLKRHSQRHPNGLQSTNFGTSFDYSGWYFDEPVEVTFNLQTNTSLQSFLTASFAVGERESLINSINSNLDLGFDVKLALVVERGFNSSTLEYTSLFPCPTQYPNKDQNITCTGRFQVCSEVLLPEDVDRDRNPFVDNGDGYPIRINALPFRAYESIYNAYYRNTQNQPFVVDGDEKFNVYNTTLEDGADITDYHLFRRNFEQDFLTSAMPSPQFGVAPLVGMTALGDVTIEDENGITTAHAEIDNDGTITKVVLTSPAASIEHARTAMNIAAAGMSINDFRSTNALQRFLETTLRKGYKYKDFITGHFGQAPEYKVLDMPEFIGGVSQSVTVNQITNMSEGVNNSPLGSFAGTANCFGQSEHDINHYCDDYGFIIGILCVVPDPAYSQLLPKHFLHSKQLDYYFPEFSQLGMQPITYKEVCPITAFNDYLADNTKLLDDTFGYQRPNYDLVAYTDQVHGLFRTQLKDFLINRIFPTRPELGTDFLEIKAEEVNDIFAYTDSNTDTILGQIVFDVKAKRPVPRITIPSLGR